MQSLSILRSFPRGVRAAVGALALVLTACGGGGTTTDNGATTATTISNTGVTQTGLRSLPADFGTRRAVAYSPYRTATSVDDRKNETITDAMVKQDLDLLVAAGFGLIRLFDSTDKVAGRVLRVIKANNLNLKVMLGAYVNSFEYSNLSAADQDKIKSANNEEIARCVALATSYPDIVQAVSVGNETQVDWSFVKMSSQQLASYISYVRSRITQPVTTDDNYAPFAGKQLHHPAANTINEVLAQVDFVSIHSYSIEDAYFSNFSDSDSWPDWDYQQTNAAAMMDAAIAKTKYDYSLARSYMNLVGKSQLPIIIGETGWKAVDPSGIERYKFLASPANQKMYYDRLMAWADSARTSGGPTSIIYFEAFDEPWKGTDDKWGLFNVNRQARYAIQGKNTASSTWVYEYKTGTTPYTDADAVYWTPPTSNDKITNNRYTLFSDAVTAGEAVASKTTADLGWATFGGNTASYPTINTDSAPGDGPNSIRVVPIPQDYGWGLLYYSASRAGSDLSSLASGTLHVSIKTTYTGKLEIGIRTDTASRTAEESYVRISSGDSSGYVNDGAWHNVSIPISSLVAANSKIDLRYVLSRFVIADRYSTTGNTKNQNTPVLIDNIYWSK